MYCVICGTQVPNQQQCCPVCGHRMPASNAQSKQQTDTPVDQAMRGNGPGSCQQPEQSFDSQPNWHAQSGGGSYQQSWQPINFQPNWQTQSGEGSYQQPNRQPNYTIPNPSFNQPTNYMPQRDLSQPMPMAYHEFVTRWWWIYLIGCVGGFICLVGILSGSIHGTIGDYLVGIPVTIFMIVVCAFSSITIRHLRLLKKDALRLLAIKEIGTATVVLLAFLVAIFTDASVIKNYLLYIPAVAIAVAIRFALLYIYYKKRAHMFIYE